MLEKLREEGISKPKKEPEINFEFDSPEKRGRWVNEARNIKKSFSDNVLFEDSSFYIQHGDRIGLFGENSCGKTTLF